MVFGVNGALVPLPVRVEGREGALGVAVGGSAQGRGGDFPAELGVFNAQMGEMALKVACVRDAALEGAEAYRLCVRPDGAEVAAREGAGAYCGLQTLRQLLLSALAPGGGGRVPCLWIEDAPRFAWRGFMLDCSRHFYQVPFIKRLLDVLSMHHINVFHWHLTDDQGWRLPVRAYPRLAQIGSVRRNRRSQYGETFGGWYSEEDIEGVVAYAAARHIMVVPEVDLPGHTLAALAAYPELGCTGGPYQVEDRTGVFDDILCAGSEEVDGFVGAVFDSLARLFPAPYVHIGGDEAPTARWAACPKCRRRLSSLGLSEPRQLQAWLTGRFVRLLAERGKTAIGWDEVLEGAADSGQAALPPDLVVMSWRGAKGGVEAVSRGRRAIMAPNSNCYLDYKHTSDPSEAGQLSVLTVRSAYEGVPARPEMTEAQAALVLGGQGNLWSETIGADRLAEYMIFPRMAALAEAFWTPEGRRDFGDFRERLAAHRLRLDSLGVLQYRGPLE